MCLNDNSATLSVRYLNAQLSAMWENAVECVGHEGQKTTVDLRSPDYNNHKYARSLAQFHFAGTTLPKGSVPKQNLLFNGTFGEPRLEFICNHEAALYLKLQNGHFDKVYPTKANTINYKPQAGAYVLCHILKFRVLTSNEQVGQCSLRGPRGRIPSQVLSQELER
jgi:hypothetical protein